MTGQLGFPDTHDDKNRFTPVPDINNCKQIACGGNYTMILLNDDNILATGDNDMGQLGLDDKEDRYRFTQVHLAVGKTGIYDIE